MNNELKILLNEFGSNLGSRNLGKLLIDQLRNNINCIEIVSLDFAKVKFVSLSFLTEIIDFFLEKGKIVNSINANSFILNQIEFTISSSKFNKAQNQSLLVEL